MNWRQCYKKDIKAAILYQIKQKDWFKQILIKKNAWGIFSEYSHTKKDGGIKQRYELERHAKKAAESMERKYANKYVAYRCMFCDGFHIGKPLKN